MNSIVENFGPAAATESADDTTRIIASNINRILHGEKPSTVVNSD